MDPRLTRDALAIKIDHSVAVGGGETWPRIVLNIIYICRYRNRPYVGFKLRSP